MKRAKDYSYYLAVAVSIITFLVYSKSLENGFVGWDDNFYVTNNAYIRSFNIDMFRWAFLEFYSYNWHPLTWISHAVDYAIWGLNPIGHHLSSNLIHASNTFLVVLIIIRLINVTKGPGEARQFLNGWNTFIVGGVTGLLFGLHPIHVESVAWVAERKDLLYSFFYLLSIISYMKYSNLVYCESLQKFNVKNCFEGQYLLTLLFFVLSLLSKPMAVTLPIVLLILDWYPFKRIQSIKAFQIAVIEKIPFIALSLASSVLTILAQKSGRAIWQEISLPARAAVAAKSLIAYLWNMVLPLDLLPFYPHPRNVSFLSPEYLVATVLVIGFTIACIVAAKRLRLWSAIWFFYVITLVPVLGIIQVGGQSMADRYTYLPSIALFLVIGLFIAWCYKKLNEWKRFGFIPKFISTATITILFIGMSMLTLRQIGVGKSGIDLWNYVIKKEPERVLFAYYNRGHIFASTGKYKEAIEDYSKVIAMNYEEYSQVYVDRGLTYLRVGQVELAAADFRKACDLGDDFGCKAIKMLNR